MITSSLMVQGKALELKKLPNVREYIASTLGVALPATVKGQKGLTGKEVTALCVAAGKTEEQVKAARKAFDTVRKQHFIHSGMAVAMLAADPSIRTTLRPSLNKAGECIGGSATFRRERSASQTQASRIAQLEKQLADALSRVAALPAS